MKAFLSALTGAVAILSATGAHAESAVAAFNRLCLGQATIDDAMAKAKEEGFVTPPNAEAARFAGAFGANAGKMMWKTDGRTSTVLLVSIMPNMKTRVFGSTAEGDVCGVLNTPHEGGVEKALQTSINAGTAMNLEGVKYFLFTEEGGKRIRLPAGARMDQAMDKPGFGAVYVINDVDRNVAGAVLMKPRKPKP